MVQTGEVGVMENLTQSRQVAKKKVINHLTTGGFHLRNQRNPCQSAVLTSCARQDAKKKAVPLPDKAMYLSKERGLNLVTVWI